MALFLATGMIGTLPALAQDDGLYEDVLDPNASFVRVVAVNLDRAMVDTTLIDQMDAGVSGYVVVNNPGDITIVTGVDESTVKIEAGKFYSFVVGADGTGTLVPEDITSSPAQAVVSFFNLSDKPLVDLFVPAAKAVAVSAVAQDASGLVALKAPLTLEFEVREGTAVLASLPAVELKRRAGVAIVFSGSGGAYSAAMAPSTIAR
jgi:alginate O-acetyltransferase complex protein AlgF